MARSVELQIVRAASAANARAASLDGFSRSNFVNSLSHCQKRFGIDPSVQPPSLKVDLESGRLAVRSSSIGGRRCNALT